ncbi:cytidylate kinase [Bacillus ectoiniformans]|uniref:(d)CMP kinase n=1 Tax=Bacillus ectoiniformans TaxID=1494429 RepID=UPI001957E4DD|nr:(d)CMP kinase [Bacillus ectoiniformans]MBM7648008.1 cytidylate kinase [Bacillus ectoiniformans]
MKKHIQIAIDGPAAAGKSTVAKIIAEKLSYIYIDTGAMYRALTYKALREGMNLEDEAQLLALLQNSEVELRSSEQGQRIFLDGEDVSEAIRTNEVTSSVSLVAAHPLVRQEMVKRQQDLSKKCGVVMDGRDIGTHVLPKAELKIFLIASVEERAKRRYEENILRGFPANLEKLKEEIALRDQLDSEREAAPLKQADDALALDTTSMSINEVVESILGMARERIGAE